jgi:hypothetical protein
MTAVTMATYDAILPSKIKDDSLRTLLDALTGTRGAGQERIARVALEWTCLLLKKNADYGSSAWKRPVIAPECSEDAAIRVRMSDKIERLHRLIETGRGEVAESIEDTIRDLGAYCLLWLASPQSD